MHVDRPTFEHSAAGDGGLICRNDGPDGRQRAVAGDDPEVIPFEALNGRVIGGAQAGGVCCERSGDGLEIRRGGRDHPQNLGGGRLLLQGLGQVGGPLLQLLEQARVGHRDRGLIRECLDDGDITGAVRASNVSRHDQDANGIIIVRERNGEYRRWPIRPMIRILVRRDGSCRIAAGGSYTVPEGRAWLAVVPRVTAPCRRAPNR